MPMSVAFVPLGAKPAHKLPQNGVRLAFGRVLLPTAVRMDWDVLACYRLIGSDAAVAARIAGPFQAAIRMTHHGAGMAHRGAERL